MRIIKSLTLKFLGLFNISLVRSDELDELFRTRSSLESDVSFLAELDVPVRKRAISLLSESKSQLRQDLFVLTELQFKVNGFFVEFGATNGVDLSNTYLLEKNFFWRGILAEPSKSWLKQLEHNRPDASITNLCVWSESGSLLTFNETPNADFSTIDDFSTNDYHGAMRSSGTRYQVETISLVDLLDKFDAPKFIDYLSIDTEGSELKILEAFDFEKYKFRVISCEHNNGSSREEIFKLLSDKGYKRKFSNISQFDDWYVYNDGETI